MTKLIAIPTTYNKQQRETIAEAVINLIVSRTQDGLDINGRPFVNYSSQYAKEKGGIPDLTVSGNMLNSLTLISEGPGFIKLGFSSKSAADKAEWQSNPTGQKDSKYAREFLGISQKDLNSILETV